MQKYRLSKHMTGETWSSNHPNVLGEFVDSA